MLKKTQQHLSTSQSLLGLISTVLRRGKCHNKHFLTVNRGARSLSYCPGVRQSSESQTILSACTASCELTWRFLPDFQQGRASQPAATKQAARGCPRASRLFAKRLPPRSRAGAAQEPWKQAGSIEGPWKTQRGGRKPARKGGAPRATEAAGKQICVLHNL